MFQQTAELDTVFYIYTLLAIFMTIMMYVILRKSRSMVNYLFSLTPLTFDLVLILNLLGYFVEVHPSIPRVPYILASLGVFYAGVYIFEGSAMKRNFRIVIFSFSYLIFAFSLVIYLHFNINPTLQGLMHISIGVPILLSIKYYNDVKKLIPAQSTSINILLVGSVLVITGSFIRGAFFIINQNTEELLLGLVTIMVGAVIVILSFTSITGKTEPNLMSD